MSERTMPAAHEPDGGAPAFERDVARPLLEARDIVVEYDGPRRLLRPAAPIRAVDGVTLHVGVGETVGVVGESGSGKSSLANAVLGFVPVSSGSIRVGDFDVTSFDDHPPRSYRRRVQVVFQDPLSSLNPSMTIQELVAEPILLHEGRSARRGIAERVVAQLAAVGLDERHLGRLPHQLSGGQRQRAAIARALAVGPELLILDEPVSALDVSTRAQVVNLLEELGEARDMAYLLIGHDLAVVRHSSDRIVVMYRGRTVEEGPADRVCELPHHPYTQLLLASVPEPDPEVQAARRLLRRELSVTPRGLGSTGCPFAPRCPSASERCWDTVPPVVGVTGGGTVRCHHPAPLVVGSTIRGVETT